MGDVVVSINGAWATFTNEVPFNFELELDNGLSFIDRSGEFVARKNNWKFKPKQVKMYDQLRKRFPTGLLLQVKKYSQLHKLTLVVNKEYESAEVVPKEIPDWAYAHQVEVVEKFLRVRRGIAELPPGKGKTKIACMIISQFPVSKVLVVVPTLDLVAQVRREIEEFIGEPVGEISGKKKQWRRVTVGVSNSLSKCAQARHAGVIDAELLIFDEHHRTPASFYQVISEAAVKAMWRLGLTATAFRGGTDSLLMEACAGPLFYRMTADNKDFMPSNLDFKYLQVEFVHKPRIFADRMKGDTASADSAVYNTWNGKPETNEHYETCVVRNRERNMMLCRLAVKFLENQSRVGSIVILADRIEHCKELAAILSELTGEEVPTLIGENNNKENLLALKNNNLKLCVGSKVLDEGIDIPHLELIVLAGANSDKRRLIQQVGRCQRTPPGKSRGWVLDVNDVEAFYLSRKAASRRTIINERYPNSVRMVSLSSVANTLEG